MSFKIFIFCVNAELSSNFS